MTDETLIAALSTPSTSSPRRSRFSLPADLLDQSCKRVGVLGIVFAGIWAFGLVLANVVTPLFLDSMPLHASAFPMPGNLIGTIGLIVSLSMTLVAGKLHHRPQLLLDMSLGFLVVTAFLFGLVQQWQPQMIPGRLTWIPVAILAFPAIAPNTPGKILVAGLLAASMDPVGVLVADLRGATFTTDPVVLTLSFAPNYVFALVAVVPAKIILGLGRQARRAQELGSYRLGEQIGKGGMGAVFRAEHRLLARQAAIKLIRPEVLGVRGGGEQQVVLARFRREAQIAAQLRSPHTIELYDFGATDNGAFYYVMELLDGVDLDTLVERHGPVPPERAVYLVQQACVSLAEAHEAGLVHRDIKPSNLVATRMGIELDFLKILDFGLVKGHDRSDQTMLTQPHMTTGTPAFMAPELALGEPAIDGRADLYALGCVLYWLLTGQLVFPGDNPVKMMHQHVSDPPDPPSRRSELMIPAELDALVLRCLAKKPAERPATAMELSSLLEKVTLDSPWTVERARRWLDTHLPGRSGDAPCDQGAIAAVMST
jgi:serine/threonine-protein kinase